MSITKFQNQWFKACVLFCFLFYSALAKVYGQDEEAIISKFQKGFIERDSSFIMPYLDKELSFVGFEKERTPSIIYNVLQNLPEIVSMELSEKDGQHFILDIQYKDYPSQKSSIYFNVKGLVNRIELVDDLITQEIQQQHFLESVKRPSISNITEEFHHKTITFSAKDSVEITADWYEVKLNSPTIILCHQARYNRKEYRDIAPRLCALGFNCLAIDQRSGGNFLEIKNMTKEAAMTAKKNTDMLDASIDIESAIEFVMKNYKTEIIVWGSSYSASLALFLSEGSDAIKGVVAFSPGNYFGDKATSIQSVIPNLEVPFIILSSSAEGEKLKQLFQEFSMKENQTQFIPSTNGFHGARALWYGQNGGEEYWNAIEEFLTKYQKE